MNPIHILYDSQMFDLQKFGASLDIFAKLYLGFT